MLARLAVEGPGLLDALLDPSAELRVFGGPALQPRPEMEAGLGGVAAVVEPAQFGQAVVVGLAWEVIGGPRNLARVAGN
jgi:hypothetical protein